MRLRGDNVITYMHYQGITKLEKQQHELEVNRDMLAYPYGRTGHAYLSLPYNWSQNLQCHEYT